MCVCVRACVCARARVCMCTRAHTHVRGHARARVHSCFHWEQRADDPKTALLTDTIVSQYVLYSAPPTEPSGAHLQLNELGQRRPGKIYVQYPSRKLVHVYASGQNRTGIDCTSQRRANDRTTGRPYIINKPLISPVCRPAVSGLILKKKNLKQG